jgi:hypothetical protein
MNSMLEASVLSAQPSESIHCTTVAFDGSTIEIYNPHGGFSMGLGQDDGVA